MANLELQVFRVSELLELPLCCLRLEMSGGATDNGRVDTGSLFKLHTTRNQVCPGMSENDEIVQIPISAPLNDAFRPG